MKPRSVSLLGLVAPTVTRVTDPLPIAAHHLAVVTRPWLLARGSQRTRPLRGQRLLENRRSSVNMGE